MFLFLRWRWVAAGLVVLGEHQDPATDDPGGAVAVDGALPAALEAKRRHGQGGRMVTVIKRFGHWAVDNDAGG